VLEELPSAGTVHRDPVVMEIINHQIDHQEAGLSAFPLAPSHLGVLLEVGLPVDHQGVNRLVGHLGVGIPKQLDQSTSKEQPRQVTKQASASDKLGSKNLKDMTDKLWSKFLQHLLGRNGPWLLIFMALADLQI